MNEVSALSLNESSLLYLIFSIADVIRSSSIFFISISKIFDCRLCQLNYSHILHYEQLESEWPQFLASVGIKQVLELPWENKGAVTSLVGYYHNISQEERRQLAAKYEADFKMFGYTQDDDF